MGFCTNCGGRLEDSHRHCGSCGSRVDPPKESESRSAPRTEVAEPPPVQNPPAKEMNRTPNSVDRRTLFAGGLLVLTPKDLILYTHDGRDEIKRIPVSTIRSCGYSIIRRCLLIKRRVNEDENFQKLLAKKHSTLDRLERKRQKHIMRSTSHLLSAHPDMSAGEKAKSVERNMDRLRDEIRLLETNPTAAKLAREKAADIKNETFRLPKSPTAPSSGNPRDEYQIWEHVVSRRLLGVSKIKIDSVPYGAVVTINDSVVGTTPLTIDKPLIDDAILEGQYRVKLLKEGYDTVTLQVTANVAKGSHLEKVKLYNRKKPDYQLDKEIGEMRRSVEPCRSIDLSAYDIEREVEGRHELLLLASDEVVICTKDREQYIYKIPYGSINHVRYDGGFPRRSKAVKINYDETHFKNLEFDFWVDDQDGRISSSSLRHRAEGLAEILNRKRKGS